jgi:hypothetical protein
VGPWGRDRGGPSTFTSTPTTTTCKGFDDDVVLWGRPRGWPSTSTSTPTTTTCKGLDDVVLT